MGARSAFAIASAKLVRGALRLAGRGATALPGLVALTVDPGLLGSLAARLRDGAVLVSGTNGKTTTSRMIADAAARSGLRVVHNRSGSNLDRGIAGALVEAGGRADLGVLEVDEASVPRVTARLAPRVVVVTNLFRDQLDRYFEVDQLARRIGAALAALPPSATLVLNADDPLVAHLAQGHSGPRLFFGVDDPGIGGKVAQNISDATRCSRCGSRLVYDRVVLGHVGAWRCPSCGLERPRRDVSATHVALEADATRLRVAGIEGEVVVPLGGLYNAYNALAALAAARALGIAADTAVSALADLRPAFGRLEVVAAEGRRLRIVLVKNPAGFNAAISALLERGGRHRLLAALNDRDADGRDVSWIWDSDFEALVPAVEHAVVTGLRARDLALRFKYAGLERGRSEVVEGWTPSIRRALALAPEGGEVVVIATYTALLALRDEMARMGYVAPFWED